MSDYDQILPGNPHPGRAERARRLWDLANDGGDDRPDLLHRSQVEATLALAYEQRTANLLKVLELQGRMHDAQQAFNLSAFDVAARLGLGDNK